MSLLKSAVCANCGEIKVLDGTCRLCTAKRIENKRVVALEKKLGLTKQRNPIIDEYLKVFGTEMRMHKDTRKTRRMIACFIIMQELRGCFQKTGDSYVMPGYNQERLDRILSALDVINNGWGKTLKHSYALNDTNEFTRLILGELGTTWR
jgi:hypothetical protein